MMSGSLDEPPLAAGAAFPEREAGALRSGRAGCCPVGREAGAGAGDGLREGSAASSGAGGAVETISAIGATGGAGGG